MGVTPDEYVGPRVHCRVRKVLQPEGGSRFRNNRHSARLVGHVCQHKKRNVCGVREHRVCELLIALVSLTLLIRRVREARRAAEIVGDGGGVTREYAGPSPYTPSSSPGLPTQAVAEGVKPTGCGQPIAIPTCVPDAKDPVTRNPPTPDPT